LLLGVGFGVPSPPLCLCLCTAYFIHCVLHAA
jgi:hypothetical protein